MDMKKLIDQSSLGTPGAKAIRAQTPQEVTDMILARAREMERQGVGDADYDDLTDEQYAELDLALQAMEDEAMHEFDDE